MTRLTLPLPPSVNRLWRGDRKGRRWLDPKAASFKQTAAGIALAAGVRPVGGPVEVHIEFYCDGRARDVDAGIKVVLDALNKIAWHDDSQVTRLSVEIHRNADRARTEVVFGPYRANPLGVPSVATEPHFTEFRKRVEQLLRRA